MFPLIPDLQKELAEYLDLEELEYLLVNNTDINLEYEVISSNKWWRYLAISKYNFTSLELDNFKGKLLSQVLLPLFLNGNKIAAGFYHSLALDTKGKLYAWGTNGFGQLGLSDEKNINIPTPTAPKLTFRTIAVGEYHSLALDTKSKLYAWGYNKMGQLGLCDYKNRNVPKQVLDLN
jgi:hypothetical protein